MCPFIGPVSRGLDLFKLWILFLPNNCLLHGLTVLDIDLGNAKTIETAQQLKAKPNWKAWPEGYIIGSDG